MKKRKTAAPSLLSTYRRPALGVVGVLAAVLLAYALIMPHRFASAEEYPVKGFDISHHQGDVQWTKISPQNYQFVYLKATEGGDFKDTKFQDNWLKAREQGFHVGAYHFYRLCRDGSIQAQNFIETVPKRSDALPPVIDLEYDSKCINTYSKDQLLKEIQLMHDQLMRHYGKQPIFYISKSFYNIVLAGEFKNTPLWVREYQGKPELKDNPAWLFWQHTNQGQIQGIPKAVDLNVFNGTQKQWNAFLLKNGLKTQDVVAKTSGK
ncbi:GH25 family lysozyme [Acinetobacter sp. ANC 3813]|uniref:glycoside hydrolase family 25 protein n=1 Tax=Acinetobacter sp. ANC 3813 TaxID=1977873 RepID=UPI000A32DA5C|nr:lysozyme [Acinetobacter sp. ANC 3813]